jgi:SAM-dependent methyltransferase
VLVDLYGEGAATLADLVREDAFRALRIAEINSIGRMHPFLAEAPGLTHVEYPEEDIQALSWDDACFDLVLTSETLEHVPDPHLALRETYRVLRPGGRHVFTVPVDPALAATRARSTLPPEHHGRGGGPFGLVTRRADMLVHTDFGRDLPDVVRAAGFDVDTSGQGFELVVIATRPVERR